MSPHPHHQKKEKKKKRKSSNQSFILLSPSSHRIHSRTFPRERDVGEFSNFSRSPFCVCQREQKVGPCVLWSCGNLQGFSPSFPFSLWWLHVMQFASWREHNPLSFEACYSYGNLIVGRTCILLFMTVVHTSITPHLRFLHESSSTHLETVGRVRVHFMSFPFVR